MFADRLKELRCENDMNQSDLAKIIGVSPSTIGMYEQGRRTPDLEVLSKIATYFQVSIDYLLGRTNIKNFEDFPPEVRNLTEMLLSADESKVKILEKLLKELLEK
ncbi:helix-turn-helix domain-containing protein [Paraclostridium bifermentans]|uniref:helix-turn-helix domain-containing protein n=1 Tax=Paraclostridium bifermentans TaxID=1490 RepID=UPI001F1D4440|nr:helix-turn-helix transcriptional regulator [Paraclostridium bifermentans]MCE9674894.1 helix-turn-helix domain-containing protein [Paraclostridium bifermentans]